jgi:signal transduction histidine kinase
MHADDQAHGRNPLSRLSKLRHDLKTPLTTIRSRAYLLARTVRRSRSLTEEEQSRILEGLAAIDAAVVAMVVIIDDIQGAYGDDDGEKAPDPP